MRIRVLNVLLLILAGVMTLSLTRGQERTGPVEAAPTRPVEPIPRETKVFTPGTALPAVPTAPLSARPARDFSKLGALQKEMLDSCQRGADWLYRVNGLKGRFVHGYLPALKTEMEGDNYLRQAGAAFALARAARFLEEDRYAARATQALLALLDETIADPSDPQCRYTSLPSAVVNRLGTAGMLVLAINELPNPQPDLLDKSEQLCNWIRRQARADGSLRCNDAEDKSEADEAALNEYPGLALYALLRSQTHRPAAWKIELARKAAPYYRTWWENHRGMAFVPWQTAAWAEAYVQTKDATFAEFVYAMNDWLTTLQYDQIDPHRLAWFGGFRDWTEGRAIDSAPTIVSAACAGSLAEACRVARGCTDLPRHQRYTEVMERSLQFVVRLQYTDANAQHFAEWYRPRLVGAFHASPRDGNLRIDYTQQALSALVAYLSEGGG